MDPASHAEQRVRHDDMSDRSAWLQEWCPTCRVAPGTRCRNPFHRTRSPTRLHVSRGWRVRRCSTCRAPAGESCTTPSGRESSAPHTTRLRPSRGELLLADAVFAGLDRLGAVGATVPFGGGAGAGGQVGRVMLTRLDDGEPVESELGWAREELAFAVAAPLWDRFGSFAGQPRITGTVKWETANRRVLISGRRGEKRCEERV